MICPNCNTPCGENDRFCYRCGTALADAPAPPAVKKGSHWVPVLIMAVICILGGILFFMDKTSGPSDTIANTDSEIPWFRVEDGTLYFNEAYYTGGEELTIPSQIDGKTVKMLSEDCFKDCTDITAVILPDTLTSIGSGAFENCTALRGITIPESVTVIGSRAFYGCTGLEAINLSDKLVKIGDDAFTNCDILFYIFFAGSHADWMALYDDFINIYAGVICEDGTFYQGGKP